MSDLCPLDADEKLIPVQRSWLFCDWVFLPTHPKDKTCRQKQRNDVYAAHCSEEHTDLCIGEKKLLLFKRMSQHNIFHLLSTVQLARLTFSDQDDQDL